MSLISRDLKHIWHPCSQMKDYEQFPPVEIHKAQGSFLYLSDGKKILDAVSSWWCKSLGHNHPRLQAALIKQAQRYEHVIGANTCQDVLVELSEKLTHLSPGLSRVFYASEGSSAVEIAVKMSLHARQIAGETKRHKLMALQNGYHGETLLALSLSDVGIYRHAYQSILLPTLFLQEIPYVSSMQDPLWQDCSSVWPSIEKQLERNREELSAIIIEPIVQAASGMKIYSQDFLSRLRLWTKKNNVHLIADEIMTGFGRTGYALACEHARVQADFVCLAKGLTAGWLPMSAVLTREEIYQHFYDDYHKQKSFLHSHTFSGNALAAAVALETLKIYQEENVFQQVREKHSLLRRAMEQVQSDTKKLENLRGIGGVVAADLIVTDQKRMGFQVFQKAMRLGVLLRPLGNTIYWVPPLTISEQEIMLLQEITACSLY